MDRLAIAAAPFIHRRLAPIAVADRESEPKGALNLAARTDEELGWLERILMKAQVPLRQDQSGQSLA